MTIKDFGHNSFVAVKGLKERIQEAEKENQMRNFRGKSKDKDERWIYGWYSYNSKRNIHMITEDNNGTWLVIPETVGQQVGFGNIYAGDYCVMDCWNGGDGIEEPNNHDIFEGVVVYDQKICRWGLQTKLCDEGQIEVGLEDSQFTSIEIIGNIHQNPELLEQENGR